MIRVAAGLGARAPGPVARTWLVTLALSALAAGLLVGPVRALPGPERPAGAALLLLLGAGFALAEVAQVHLYVRGETHTISFAEIPLVVGLFLAAPWQLALAQGGAAVVMRLFWLRQAPVKQLFNIAVPLLELSVVSLLVAWAARSPDPTDPRSWLAVLGAMLAASVFSAACVGLVIAASDPEAPLSLLAQTSASALGVTVVNTATGLAAAALVRVSPIASALLLVPAGMLLLAYRAYAVQLQERRRVDFLLAFTRRLHESATAEAGLAAALTLAKETLRAVRLEIVTTGPPVAPVISLNPVEQGAALRQLARQARGSALLLTLRGRRKEDKEAAELLGALRVDQAMVAPLRGAGEGRAALAALGRAGSVSRFVPADLALLDALAEQLALVLERDFLAGTVHSLRSLQDQLVHTATHDALTGLPNRRHLLEQLDGMLSERVSTGAAPAVLFVDLDGFKSINDRLGHAAGDDLLAEMARRLSGLLGPQDVAARLGGDEFVTVLADTPDERAAVRFAERACRELTAPLVVAGRRITVGASVGVARATADVATAEELLERADEVMYEAKSRAGGVRVYDDVAHANRTRRRFLQDDLTSALAGDGLSLAYQPIVSLATGQLTGVEALARWQHPEHGPVAPDVFIALAEATGQIGALGQLVLRAACRQLATWQHEHPGRALTMAVNVSTRELQSDTYAPALAAVLAETGADPTGLVLEVTESATLGDEAHVVAQIQQLRGLGVRIAVDDFGSGYASLHQLRLLPVDLLKIDRALLAGAAASADERTILKAITELGAGLRLTVVAEGVETAEQQQLCRQLGVPLGQGWLFGRPGPVSAIDDLLARQPVTRSPSRSPDVIPLRRRPA